MPRDWNVCVYVCCRCVCTGKWAFSSLYLSHSVCPSRERADRAQWKIRKMKSRFSIHHRSSFIMIGWHMTKNLNANGKKRKEKMKKDVKNIMWWKSYLSIATKKATSCFTYWTPFIYFFDQFVWMLAHLLWMETHNAAIGDRQTNNTHRWNAVGSMAVMSQKVALKYIEPRNIAEKQTKEWL